MMTDPEAQKIVTMLVTAYPNMFVRLAPEQQQQTMTTYRAMLRDLDYDVAMAAVARLLATLRYMPTASEIRESALAVTVGEQTAGGEQWGRVLDAIRTRGIYRVPGKDFVFFDPVTARCVSALGWSELCNSENVVADRARFIELYDKMAGQERRKQLSENLKPVRELEAKRQAQIVERTGANGIGELMGKVLSLAAGGDS